MLTLSLLPLRCYLTLLSVYDITSFHRRKYQEDFHMHLVLSYGCLLRPSAPSSCFPWSKGRSYNGSIEIMFCRMQWMMVSYWCSLEVTYQLPGQTRFEQWISIQVASPSWFFSSIWWCWLPRKSECCLNWLCWCRISLFELPYYLCLEQHPSLIERFRLCKHLYCCSRLMTRYW